jgi:hypothetical protein
MDDQLNVPLEDYELLAEVEMTTNLIIAASAADAPLSQSEVDRLLGLDAQGGAGSTGPDGSTPHQIPLQKVRSSA